MFTTMPRPRLTMSRASACEQNTVPSRLTPSTARQVSGVTSRIEARGKIPALLTSPNTPPKRAIGLIGSLRDLRGIGDVDLTGDDVDAHLRALVGGFLEPVFKHVPKREHGATPRQLDARWRGRCPAPRP